MTARYIKSPVLVANDYCLVLSSSSYPHFPTHATVSDLNISAILGYIVTLRYSHGSKFFDAATSLMTVLIACACQSSADSDKISSTSALAVTTHGGLVSTLDGSL